MAYQGMTGQGVTVAFTTLTGGVGCIRDLQLQSETVEKIDTTCLDTVDNMTSIPGDVGDPGQITLVAVFDPTITPPDKGDLDTITVTFPIPADGTTAATLSGTGFFTEVGYPQMTVNGLLEMNLVFTFDGDTGPTYTPGT